MLLGSYDHPKCIFLFIMEHSSLMQYSVLRDTVKLFIIKMNPVYITAIFPSTDSKILFTKLIH